MMSRNFILSCSIFWLCSLSFFAHAQKTTRYDLADLLQKNQLVTKPSTETRKLENSIPGAISTKGMVWLKGVNFKEGTIDIDLRGKNVFLQSFLGIAFHAVDTTTYDVLYFRPFNFRHADTLRRKWSVQYLSMPDYSWDKLRKEHPLVYENAVSPVPEPDAWFHAAIVIRNGWISVFVNHAEQPSLKVRLLNDRNEGLLGLWDDELSGDFANLTISR
jgi:hypothetical protein